MLYKLATFLTYSIISIFFKIEIIGKNLIPANKHFLLASNHLSKLDPPLLAACCPARIGFIAKRELFKNKLFGACIRLLGAIPLDRERAGVAIIRLCLKTLKSKSLLIFPQGSRGRSLDDALSGVGFLCKKGGVPVVAAKIYGTDKIFYKRERLFKRRKIKVVFSLLDNIVDSDTYKDISLKVVNRIKDL